MKLNTSQIQRAVAILYVMNVIDALLTIYWVESGIATEANGIMDAFLAQGVMPFLFVKLGMGTFAAVVLLIGSDYKLARVGLAVALCLYTLTMGIHLITGIAAAGFLS